ncbi:MAG: hypothetical protein WCK43_09235 [bacterium]
MSNPGSKNELKNIQTNHQKEKGSLWAWIGSVFLWFVTPTGASALWEKWLTAREKDSDEQEAQQKESEPKDSSSQS